MRHSIYKAAKKFIKKELHNQVDLRTLSTYLQKLGYAIVFYSRDKDNEILVKYNLVEYSKTVKAFTLYRKNFKAVFVDDDVSVQNKLYSLLHEVSHIILRHIDKRDVQESRMQEMEADAFAYAVLNPVKSRIPIYIALAVICFSLVGMFVGNYVNKATVSSQNMQNHGVMTIEEDKDNLLDEVFVTPSGIKYHISTCRYIKGKDCTMLTVQEARKKYAPCSVCQP